MNVLISLAISSMMLVMIVSVEGGGMVSEEISGQGAVSPHETPLPSAIPVGVDVEWKGEGRWIGPCSDWWVGENLTPAMWEEDPERGRRMMQRLVVCVFGTWAPGESVTALIVADRESGFYPWAKNVVSGCSGIFQHIMSAWPGRREDLLWRGWFGKWLWPVSVFDPRANAIAAARMVRGGGWGPWGM